MWSSISVVTTHHVQQLSQSVQRNLKHPSAAPSEKRRDREAGADGGEVVLRVHSAAVREVRAWSRHTVIH